MVSKANARLPYITGTAFLLALWWTLDTNAYTNARKNNTTSGYKSWICNQKLRTTATAARTPQATAVRHPMRLLNHNQRDVIFALGLSDTSRTPPPCLLVSLEILVKGALPNGAGPPSPSK